MSKWSVMAALIAGVATFAVIRVIHRRREADLQNAEESAEARAEKAERRAEAYRHQLAAHDVRDRTPVHASASAEWIATAPFPYEKNVKDLRDVLFLTEDQVEQLRAVYMKRWETTKQASRSGALPEVPPLEEQARGFLSAAQLQTLAGYMQEKRRTNGARVAQEQARLLKDSLALTDDQVLRMAEVLAAFYTTPPATASTKVMIDQLAGRLHPVLTGPQLKSFLATIEPNLRPRPAATE